MAAAPLRSIEPATRGSAAAGLDVGRIRREFPIFDNNPGLVFLDSGASAQKPRQVIDGIAEFYRTDYANVHRGVYRLSARSTDRFEEAREKARALLNAAADREIVFVRGATEAINLVAQSWGPASLKAGDEIVISDVEHHSNIVPWQQLRDRLGLKLVVAPTDDTGEFDLARFEALLSPRTRLVAVTHVSNVTGATLPVERIIALAHAQRRQGADRRLSGGAAHAGRCARARLRFLRLFRPQGLRSDRDRRAVGALRAARSDAALADRRRHDPQCRDRPHRLPGPAAPLRGRHPRYRRRGRARPRLRLYREDRPRGDPRARGGADRLCGRSDVAHSGGHGRARRPAAHQRVFVQCRGGAPARCRHRARPAQCRGPGRPPLRAAADGKARAGRHRARLARRLQRRGRHRPPRRGDRGLPGDVQR